VRERLEKLGATDFELRPGKSGQFDVTIDGALKYTRSKTGRFPTDDEIDGLAQT
jgi:predicted Rdx family selenoprotein